MSEGKSLGRIAFEAWWSTSSRPRLWGTLDSCHQGEWEKVANTVAARVRTETIEVCALIASAAAAREELTCGESRSAEVADGIADAIRALQVTA